MTRGLLGLVSVASPSSKHLAPPSLRLPLWPWVSVESRQQRTRESQCTSWSKAPQSQNLASSASLGGVVWFGLVWSCGGGDFVGLGDVLCAMYLKANECPSYRVFLLSLNAAKFYPCTLLFKKKNWPSYKVTAGILKNHSFYIAMVIIKMVPFSKCSVDKYYQISLVKITWVVKCPATLVLPAAEQRSWWSVLLHWCFLLLNKGRGEVFCYTRASCSWTKVVPKCSATLVLPAA